MSEWDHVAKFKPAAPPYFEQSREMWLKRPYILCWINPRNEVSALGASHLRKTAERKARTSMLDSSSRDVNHHTRFYIWDSSLPWNPDDLYSWTPIAERARDQWHLKL